MKKVFCSSQIPYILGPHTSGSKMHLYNLPYLNAAGLILPYSGNDVIELMIEAVAYFTPEIHIVTRLLDGRIVNKFENDGQYYMLFKGDDDPNIELSNQFLVSDLPETSRTEKWKELSNEI